MRQKRSALTPQLRAQKNSQIFERLCALPVFIEARTIACYVSLPDEVDTWELLRKFYVDKTFYIPRMDDGRMRFVKLEDPQLLTVHQHGVFTAPVGKPLDDVKKLDLVIVPGISFDYRGNRLGFGGGNFDRFLAQVNCTTIGLAYELQIVAQLPVGPYDVPVQLIITEQHTLYVSTPTVR